MYSQPEEAGERKKSYFINYSDTITITTTQSTKMNFF